MEINADYAEIQSVGDVAKLQLKGNVQIDPQNEVILDIQQSSSEATITVGLGTSKYARLKDAFKTILDVLEEGSNREGLQETPNRAAKAWLQYWAAGYDQDPKEILKTFEDGAKNSRFVMVEQIPVYSHCEHHLAPIVGTATVCYVPDGKIVGLSKINRLVDCFARRLQVQERLTSQIANCLMDELNCIAVGVHIRARHLCMESRGVKQNSETTTLLMLGGFDLRNDNYTYFENERTAFLAACK